MFKIMNQDILLGLTLVKGKEKYTVDNICGIQDGGEVIVRIRPAEGELARSLLLREAAAEYFVDGSPRTLGQWLSDEVSQAEPHLKALLEMYAAPDGAAHGAPSVPRGLAEKSRRLFKFGALRSLGNQTGDMVLAQLKRWLDEDRRIWQGAKVREESSSEPVVAEPEARFFGFLRELKRAWTEAEYSCVASGAEELRFEHFLCRALEKHWTDVVRGANLLRLIGQTEAGTARVEAEVRQVEPSQRVEKSGGRRSLRSRMRAGDRAGARAAYRDDVRISITSDGSGADIIVEICFSTQKNASFVAKLTTHCGRAGSSPKAVVRQLKDRLTGYISDIRWALQEHFSENDMAVFAQGGLAFKDLQELEGWLTASGDPEGRVRRLWSSARRGGPQILSGEDPSSMIAEWLKGAASMTAVSEVVRRERLLKKVSNTAKTRNPAKSQRDVSSK